MATVRVKHPKHPKPYEGPMAQLKELPFEKTGTPGWGGEDDLIAPIILLPLKLKPSDRVLDVGCGLGNHIVPASYQKFRGSKELGVKLAVGVDMDGSNIRLAEVLASAYPELKGILTRSLKRLRHNFLHANLGDEFEQSIRGKLESLATFSSPEDESKTPKNLQLMNCNLYHLPFPDDSFDKTLNISVASYIKDETNRRNMLKDLLRVTKEGGLIHISSFAYNKADGSAINAPEELKEIAEKLGVELKTHNFKFLTTAIRHGYPLRIEKGTYKFGGLQGAVYEIKRKSQPIPSGVFRD
ncbi:MAG: class I SAM-dependent methyltransferase [Candidatus Altiarchaeota archaeon]